MGLENGMEQWFPWFESVNHRNAAETFIFREM